MTALRIAARKGGMTLVAGVFLLLVAGFVRADIFTAFTPSAEVITPISYHAIINDAAGRRLVFGQLTSSLFVMRLNADNSLDASFGSSGYRSFALGGNGEIPAAIRLLSNGDVVVASRLAAVSYGPLWYIGRIDSDGNLVTGYGTSGVATITAFPGELQQDGALTVDGSDRVSVCSSVRNTATGERDVSVFRLTSSGAADTTFDGDGRIEIGIAGRDEGCRMLHAKADGSLLVMGSYTQAARGYEYMAHRTSSGARETGEPADGYSLLDLGSTLAPKKVVAGPDGKLYWLGNRKVLRTDTAGVPDATYGVEGQAVFDPGYAYDGGVDLDFDPAGRLRVLLNTGTIAALSVHDTSGALYKWRDVRQAALTANGLVASAAGVTTLIAHPPGMSGAVIGTLSSNDALYFAEPGVTGQSLGFIELGQTVQHQVLLTNDSDTPQAVSVVADSAEVTVSGCASVVAADSQCLLTLTVLPLTPGSIRTTVRATSADGATPATYDLDWYSPVEMLPPQLSATQVQMSTPAGTTVTYRLVIRNPSVWSLPIGASEISGSGFELENSCAGVLLRKARCILNVAFSPETDGAAIGQLKVYYGNHSEYLLVTLEGDTTGKTAVKASGGDISSGGGGGGGGAIPGFLLAVLLLMLGARSIRVRAVTTKGYP